MRGMPIALLAVPTFCQIWTPLLSCNMVFSRNALTITKNFGQAQTQLIQPWIILVYRNTFRRVLLCCTNDFKMRNTVTAHAAADIEPTSDDQ